MLAPFHSLHRHAHSGVFAFLLNCFSITLTLPQAVGLYRPPKGKGGSECAGLYLGEFTGRRLQGSSTSVGSSTVCVWWCVAVSLCVWCFCVVCVCMCFSSAPPLCCFIFSKRGRPPVLFRATCRHVGPSVPAVCIWPLICSSFQFQCMAHI